MNAPPHAVETEKALLGAILIDGESFDLIKNIVQPESFYRPNHGIIFSAMQELDKELVPVDIVSVSEKLKQQKKLDAIGGQAYLIELGEISPSSANIEYYAKVVAEKKTLRDILDFGIKIQKTIHENGRTPSEVIELIKKDLIVIESFRTNRKIETVRENISIVNEKIDKKIASGKTLHGIPTGFAGLDRYFGGWIEKRNYIVGARQGMGKTTLAMNTLVHAALSGFPAAIISLEMSKEQLLNKSVSAMTGIPLHYIVKEPQLLTARDRERINTALDRLKKIPLYIDDSENINLDTNIIASITHLVKEKGVKLIAIDHIGKFRFNTKEKKFAKTHELHREFSNQLDKLAEHLGYAQIILSQLNPKSVDRTTYKPAVNDIKESQAYAEDADGVALIYRREKTYELENKKADRVPDEIKGVAEIYIAKNREGDEGKIRLRFEGAQSRFVDDEDQHQVNTEPTDQRDYEQDDDEKPF